MRATPDDVLVDTFGSGKVYPGGKELFAPGQMILPHEAQPHGTIRAQELPKLRVALLLRDVFEGASEKPGVGVQLQ
ncbi:MAG: hypothetical protein M3262_05675, partial [Actinomycetota bacterium]|nr:hypothetical protein [Actinomycetota bacterium]